MRLVWEARSVHEKLMLPSPSRSRENSTDGLRDSLVLFPGHTTSPVQVNEGEREMERLQGQLPSPGHVNDGERDMRRGLCGARRSQGAWPGPPRGL